MKRRQVIMVAAAAIMVGLVWFTYATPLEPRYKGKSLTEWLSLYRPYGRLNRQIDQGMSEEEADAVRHIGTNALPFLVAWMERQHDVPSWKLRLFRMASRWKASTPGRSVLLARLDPHPSPGEQAMWGFFILGQTARMAAPDLVRVARNGDRPSADFAIISLRYLGIDALGPLLSMITNTANTPLPLRYDAMNSLGEMGYLGTNAHPGIVLLINRLDDPDLGALAASVLGTLHLESEISVPALIKCTRSTNVSPRRAGIASLGQFGPRIKESAVPVLTKLLDDPDASVRYAATHSLELIAPEVSTPSGPAFRHPTFAARRISDFGLPSVFGPSAFGFAASAACIARAGSSVLLSRQVFLGSRRESPRHDARILSLDVEWYPEALPETCFTGPTR